LASTSLHITLPERYRVIRHVASGGMAAVYAADDELLGRRVAVKVLSPAFASDAPARARFMREARAAARVSDHPHVVTIYDVGEAPEGQAFIVMELLPGGTLNDRIKRGDPIPHLEALRWLRETASALDAAHKADVVHRDVKPANLLLDDTGAVRVGDFGIATLASETSSITQTGQVVGTAAYLSPEQALGKPAVPASDRYALAVVAFELLTGRRPFTAAHPTAQARAHVDSAVPEASDVAANLPIAVDDVLARGMAKDPADRPPSARALVDELEVALGPTAATAIAPTPRFRRDAPPPAGVAIPDPDRPDTLRPEDRVQPVRPRRAAAGGATEATRARRPAVASPPPPRARAPRPAPASAPPPSHGRLRALALAAALLLVAGAAIAAVVSGSGGGGGPERAAATTAPKTTAKRTTSTKAAAPATATPATTAAAAPTTTTSATPAAPDPAAQPEDKVDAQLEAHSLIGQGRYDDAIAMLQSVVPNCPVTTTNPCAYAIYDLGYALVKAGRTAEAVQFLRLRLQNPNQRGAVQGLLDDITGGADPEPGNGKAKKPKGPRGGGFGRG